MTTITNQNVKVRRGDTALLAIALTAADNTPYNPSGGALIKWRLAPTSHATDAEAMALKELSTGGIVVVAGGVEITLNSADTNFQPDIYYHELKVLDAGDVDTTCCGAFVIKPSLPMS